MGILNLLERWQMPLDRPAPPLPTGAFRFVGAIAWVFKWTLLVRVGLEGCAALLATYNPYFYKLVIDALTGESTAGPIPAETQYYLLLYIGVALVGAMVLEHLSRLVNVLSLNTTVVPMVRNWLYSRQLGHSLGVFQDTFAGSLASQVREAAEGAHNLLGTFTGSLVWAPVAIVTGVYLFWGAHVLLMAPLVVWTVLYVVVQFPQILKLDKLSAVAAEIRSRVTGFMVDTFGNIATVKLFANLNHERMGITRELTVERRTNLGLQWGYFKLDIGNGVLQTALDAATLVVAVWLRYQQLITTGDVVMAMGLVHVVRNNVRYIAWEMSSMLESRGQLQQALDQLLQPVTVTDAEDAKPLVVGRGRLEFMHIGFRYNPTTPVVIEGLQLVIPAGQKVGLVGPSGAGKSTLVNLLLRFYDVNDGAIAIDGQDIRNVQQDSLRAQIGMVTQDTSLMHRSIAENIGYGKVGASRDAIVAAAKKAHAHDFIVGLADKDGNTGYDVKVGERGVKLSGGQRQRIAIARLILKNAPILLLDEATSALDSEAEAAIQENLAVLMKGKTVIAIAHRLSTIAKLDRLVVLDKGRIVEDGSHAELLAKGGLYARLWAHQSGGFLQD